VTTGSHVWEDCGRLSRRRVCGRCSWLRSREAALGMEPWAAPGERDGDCRSRAGRLLKKLRWLG
jgi:hypothetical protein